jgi:hypothetical protein
MSGKTSLALSISALLMICVLGSAKVAAAQEAPPTPAASSAVLADSSGAPAAAEGTKDGSAVPAAVQVPKNSLELDVVNHYILGDLGKKVANGAVQGSYLRKVWNCLAGTWVSLGPDDYAKEVDLISFCDGKIGLVAWEVSLQDFFLNGRGGPLVMGNNVAQGYAEGNIPIKAATWLTVAPAARVTQQVGFGAFPDHTILQAGARVTVKLTEQDSIGGAVLPTLVDPGKGSQYGLTRIDARYTHVLGHGLSLFVGLRDHSGRPQEAYTGLGYSW